MRPFFIIVISLLFIAFPSVSYDIEIGETIPNLAVVDSKGTTMQLADFAGKMIILEWTNYRCPYVKKHYLSGSMQKLQRQFTEDGIVWLSAISSAKGKSGYMSGVEADKIAMKRGSYASHIIIDDDGRLGKAFGATVTPTIAFIDKKSRLQYFGAIDDQPSARISSIKGAKNYLLAAVQELENAGKVTESQVDSYGCPIKYAE